MPKLLAYLPCEKVVIEEQLKNVSVLSILETVTVTLAPGAPAPSPNAAIGMTWAIFTLWQKDPGESGRFESKSILVSPEGDELAQTPVASIDFEKGVRQQVVNRMASFPIWTPGTCQLKLMVKTARDPDFRPLASVLIMLRHSRS
jgi:hypothetical protein